MLFINATLSKNRMYKLKNQVNNVPTISKQDDIELFSKYFSRHLTNVTSAIYFRVIIMEVMLWNNDMLFWEFFVNLLAIIRPRL